MKKEDLKITTYQDGTGYVFVSYSSADEEVVFDKYIVPLQEKYGLRVFCDKNFKNRANQTWTRQMNDNISEASCCLLFVSKTYSASYACLLEALHAAYHKVPVLKIQLESPSVMRDFANGKMSDSTRDAFKTIGKMLGNSGFLEEENCCLRLKDQINSGEICKYDSSKVFCEYLNKIQCTRLNESDGLEAIVRSLEAIQKDRGMDGSMFEVLTAEPKQQVEAVASATVEIPARQEAPEELKLQNQEQPNFQEKPELPKGKLEYSIYGKTYTDNQSNMMITVFSEVLARHADKLEQIIDMQGMECLSATNYTLRENQGKDMPTYFRTARYLAIGSGVTVGTSYDLTVKLKKIAILLAYCNEPCEVFMLNNAELMAWFGEYYESRTKKVQEAASNAGTNGKGMPEKYKIYGKSYTGNQTEMMTDVLKAIMERNFDKREALAVNLLSIKLADREALKDICYFRTGKTFVYSGVVYSIGTSFGRPEKLNQIRKAIQICGENPDNFEIEGLLE